MTNLSLSLRDRVALFSNSSSSFTFPLFLLFLVFSLLFLSCPPSSLVVHLSLWRLPLSNRLLCFLFLLSYFLCLSLLSLFSEFMCYFSFTDSNVALLESFSIKEILRLIYNIFFKDHVSHFFLTLKNHLKVTIHS